MLNGRETLGLLTALVLATVLMGCGGSVETAPPLEREQDAPPTGTSASLTGTAWVLAPAEPAQPTWTPESADCSGPNAFPMEEAELIWPTLVEVQPDSVVPGDQVEILAVGGHLHWDKECGSLEVESARDFGLFFAGKPAGLITCYAYNCRANLIIPADTPPGVHTLSVEGGSGLDIEVRQNSIPPATPTQSPLGAAPPTATPGEGTNLRLVGYLGSGQARAVAVQGDYAYVGIDIELAVVDISDPGHPWRVGYLVLPGPILDVAAVHEVVYVVVGNGAGLYILDVTDPTNPMVRDNYVPGEYVSSVVVAGDRAYVSGVRLRILDIADPAAPTELGDPTLAQDPVTLGERVVAVAGDQVYTLYDHMRGYGFRIVDLSDPNTPTVLGSLDTDGPIHDMVLATEHAYLLVGSNPGRLVIADVSDPRNPRELDPERERPWRSSRLAAKDRYLYLVDYELRVPEPVGALQVLDIADPANPAVFGRYTGLSPELLDLSVAGERAYVATGDGLAILDISDAAEPAAVGFHVASTLPGTGRDVVVEGKTAYVAAGEAGLQVVDTSDPVNPKVVGKHDTAGHAWALALNGGYAYVADEYNGLRVLALSDPLHPTEVSSFDVPGAHEFFHGIAIAAGAPQGRTYAYIADGGLLATGLRVVDVSDPTHPREVAFLSLAAAETESTQPPRLEDVEVANGYAFLAAGTAGLRVVDVSDPTTPVEIGSYDTPGRADNLAVVGNYAYLADGDLRILDISDPSAPAQVGFYDLPDMGKTPHVVVVGRHAYLTGDGISVLDVSDPGAPLEVARHPIPSGSVAVAGPMIYAVDDGLYTLRLGAGTDARPSP